MQHAEKRANLWYAVLTVPPDVRHIVGKLRFVQSTQTADKQAAALRVALLVAQWKAEIAKARGTLPDTKATFWENMRRDYLSTQDEGTQLAIEAIVEAAALKIPDPDEASQTYRIATGQAPELVPLAPLVEAWKGPHRPRARQQAQSEEDGTQPRRRRVKDVDRKKTEDEEEAGSNRLKKGRFGSALTPDFDSSK